MAQQINEITSIPSNSNVLKILNQVIKRYNSLGSIYTFKGSVQTYDDLLAIQNPQIGDVYNVIQEDEEHQIAAGSNFVWDGTVWDNLGGSLAGLVQSVNGINPDSLGNVLLPLIKNITTNQGVITFTKNDDTTIQTDNIKKLYTVGLGQTVDLNNLVEAGIYMCGNDSYAANYENCPVQKSFLLEVQQANDGSMVYQFLTQYNDGSTEAGNQYVRTYQATNGWSVWRMAGSGSNLTTYTSLEQIGITPGEETFASIHNALPINSVLEYFVTPFLTSANIYPSSTGLFRVFKSFNSTNILTCEFYTTFSNESKQYAQLWSTLYNSNFPNSAIEWSRHYNVSRDGTLAKQSDLTNAINSLGTISTKDMSNNTAYLDKAAYIAGNGVMEIGKYIDFHIAGSSNTDYDVRLEATKNGLIIGTPGLSGALGYWTISKGTNGWARESSTGFTIQWGFISGSQGTKTITLNRNFSNTNYAVVVTPQGGRGLTGSIFKNKTTSNFQGAFWGYDSADVANGLAWIAVGIS